MRTLQEAAHEASTCTKCRLAGGRTQVVYGTGNADANLMFIGEGPGYYEDKQGEPFVGAAGQLLNRMLEEIGVLRADVYIANVIKCLRYNASVQLADGSWERIGRLARSRYDGEVMSVDAEGKLVPRQVIGLYESPLAGRRVFRLTYRSAKNAGLGQASTQLTGDHPVLTERGYVPVEELRPTDRIATGQGLSALALDVVCGTVLGDGHLSRSSAHLSFAHSGRQEEYALFKAELLAELSPRVDAVPVALVAGGDRVYPRVHVRTLAHRALGVLRRDFYATRKRVPAWMAERLNLRMLAIWFLDDGYMRIRPGRQSLAEIATVDFHPEDLQILLQGLIRLGLPGKALRGRLFFDVLTTKVLSVLLAPYVPPSMRYKLDPALARAIPFDASLWRPGPAEVMYDDIEIMDVTDQARSDTTFFCLDVEETHNFVTAGGVVHNCRPPGNRDPMPEEVDACTPWLQEQIALIDPRVIVPLGNFATRFMLDKPVSISRVRGQRFPLEGRTVIPTFHPAAILRGGGEASPQMAALRSDFQEIKRALAEMPEPVEEQLGLF
jgi:uracil-DNA glycosylase